MYNTICWAVSDQLSSPLRSRIEARELFSARLARRVTRKKFSERKGTVKKQKTKNKNPGQRFDLSVQLDSRTNSEEVCPAFRKLGSCPRSLRLLSRAPLYFQAVGDTRTLTRFARLAIVTRNARRKKRTIVQKRPVYYILVCLLR